MGIEELKNLLSIATENEIKSRYDCFLGKTYYVNLGFGRIIHIKGYTNIDVNFKNIMYLCFNVDSYSYRRDDNSSTPKILDSHDGFDIRKGDLCFCGIPCIEIDKEGKRRIMVFLEEMRRKEDEMWKTWKEGNIKILRDLTPYEI